MTEPVFGFDVILADADDAAVGPLSEAIAAFKKIPFQDAAREVRNCWGVLGKNLSETEAKRLISILETKGLRSRAIPAGSFDELPAVEVVKSLSLDASGLHLVLSAETAHISAPADLSVIAGVGLPLRSVKVEKIVEGPSNAQRLLSAGMMLAGIPIPIPMKKKRTIEKTTVKEDVLYFADLLTKSPARRFRLDAQNLSYAFLKERMVYNTLLNFKLLLKDLVQWAPQALTNKGTRALVNNQILGQLGHENFSHLDQELRWLSTLAR